MKILVIGAGALGNAIGACLIKSGHRVDFLATPATKAAIDNDGVHMNGLFGNIDIAVSDVTAYGDFADLPSAAYDFVLICVKTLSNQEIAALLAGRRDILKDTGKIVIMQNGLGNDRPYRQYFTEQQIYSARIITGFKRNAPNRSEVTVHTSPLLLGSLFGCDIKELEPLATAINDAGLPCQTSDQISKVLWAKMLYSCILNPLGAILRVNYGKLGDNPNTVAIMDKLIDEIYAVMKAGGQSTFWETPEQYRSAFYGKALPDTYHHRSSTLQDIEKQQKTEIDTLTGYILSEAAAYHIAVPYNEMLYRMIKAIEADF